jgi:hypothetical protein
MCLSSCLHSPTGEHSGIVVVEAVAARKVEVDQIVGATEISNRLGLRHTTHVHQLRKSDPTFPAPIAQLSPGPSGAYIWYWPDIEWWTKRMGRLPLGASNADGSTARSRHKERA